MRARDYKKTAKKALKGRYWWALLAAIISWVFGALSIEFNGNEVIDTTAVADATVPAVKSTIATFIDVIGNTFNIYDLSDKILTFIKINSVGLAIIAIVVALIGCAVGLGYRLFNIELFKTTEKPELGIIFSRMHYIGKAFLLGLRVALRIIGGFILFIIPGIIAIYKYFPADYILAENPELSTGDVLKQSKQMMKGRKWRKFCLDFSFILWDILAGIVPGGMVFLTPFKQSADTAFYIDMTGRFAPAQPAAAEE